MLDSAYSNVKQGHLGNQMLRVQEQPFFKIGVVENLAMFTGKHLCQKLFSIKLQVLRHEALLNMYSIKNVFQRWVFGEYYEIFKNRFFHRTPPVTAFEGLCHKQRHFFTEKGKTETALSCNFQETAGHILLVLKKR